MTTEATHSMSDERIDQLIQRYTEYADNQNIILNPDTKRVHTIVRGLLNREERHGATYCPCRVLTGDSKNDKKHVCPCAYHLDEIARDGHCLCNLFVAPNGENARQHEPT